MSSDQYLDHARYPSDGTDMTRMVSWAQVSHWYYTMPSLRRGDLFDLIRIMRENRTL